MSASSDSLILLARLRQHDHTCLSRLEQMSETNPKELSAGIRSFLLMIGIGDDPSFCIELIKLLNQALGQVEAERYITQLWETGDRSVRDNITCGAFDPQSMSTDFVLKLFEIASNTVRDRHHLLAGLASSMTSRACERQVRTLIPKIGVYDDSAKQAVLVEFIASVEQSLGESA